MDVYGHAYYDHGQEHHMLFECGAPLAPRAHRVLQPEQLLAESVSPSVRGRSVRPRVQYVDEHVSVQYVDVHSQPAAALDSRRGGAVARLGCGCVAPDT